MLQLRMQSDCQLHTIKPDFYVFGFPFPLRALILNVGRKSTNKIERSKPLSGFLFVHERRTEIDLVFICCYGKSTLFR